MSLVICSLRFCLIVITLIRVAISASIGNTVELDACIGAGTQLFLPPCCRLNRIAHEQRVLQERRALRLMPLQRVARGGTRGTVYRDVARLRMGDAQSLFAQGRHNGAIYLAGYAIECHLKFAYCQRKDQRYLPGILEVHDWDRLVDKAGLLPVIQNQSQMDSIYSALVDEWGPSLRYRTNAFSAKEANRLYKDMEQLYRFLRELVP